ncbi:MAG: DsbA family protein [Myxococcaceae bacterium]|nr:DsbA family protein [Myxococcaceae bacterium]MCI0673429.1 DsbA family protein [Myxococcaceae bacterium]
MKPNVFIALAVGGVLGFALGRVVSPATPSAGSPSAPTVAAAPSQAPRPAVRPTVYRKATFPAEAPSWGPKEAKVTIVEWSDFQCPFCSRVNPTLKQIKETYPNDVRIVFRHQPLPMHPDAPLAAQASMAAHEQGKFWEYHDRLFENQRKLDRGSLEQYAQELGLNVAQFKAALDSRKYEAYVQKDSQDGSAAGASGTPTFFVNGRQVVGAQPFANFKTAIDEELARASKLLAEGTQPAALYQKLLDTAPVSAPEPSPSAAAEPRFVKVDVGQAPLKGKKTAPITIVAYSDFQCPFCSRAVPTLKELETRYGDKVQIAFKHLPLGFHANAKPAAEASMAAHEQGKFWEYHDKLFANQRQLDRASLEKYAQELGLNMAKFKAALDSGKFASYVDTDAREANSVGATGTPTFVINGRMLVGAQPVDAFARVIDEELSKAAKK